MVHRYLNRQIEQDLRKKMVFLAGPRQVGKTTLTGLVHKNQARQYLNWDIFKDRQAILKQTFDDVPLWIFDEIHKYRKWRNYLKGLYDEFKGKKMILVTGSAKLDLYRFGGDSLQGRYHFLRLNPLSCAELKISKNKALQELFELGGFPEPFFSSSKQEANRWSAEYHTRFIHEDVLDLESVKDIGSMELLAYRLPECVGSPLSINSLREDLALNHKTVSKWIDIFERLYSIFRVLPYTYPTIKAVKKESKHYHFDWNLIDDAGARFENMIAVHLLKYVQWIQDSQARDMELRFFRDIEGREVDFIIVEKRKPVLLVECKLSDAPTSDHLAYLKRKFPEAMAWQVHLNGKKDYLTGEGIRMAPALELLKDLV